MKLVKKSCIFNCLSKKYLIFGAKLVKNLYFLIVHQKVFNIWGEKLVKNYVFFNCSPKKYLIFGAKTKKNVFLFYSQKSIIILGET